MTERQWERLQIGSVIRPDGLLGGKGPQWVVTAVREVRTRTKVFFTYTFARTIEAHDRTQWHVDKTRKLKLR